LGSSVEPALPGTGHLCGNKAGSVYTPRVPAEDPPRRSLPADNLGPAYTGMEHPQPGLAVVPIARCPPDRTAFNNRSDNTLIVLGIILLIIGFVANIAILWTVGVIVIVVGALFAVLGFAGREIGGRKHWY